MKNTKVISCLLAAALIAASFAGCGESKAAASSEDKSSKQEQRQQPQRGNFAKVVSLEGNKLTVNLADMPDRSSSAPPGQTGSTSGSAAQSDGKPPQNGTQTPDSGGKPGDGHQGQTGQGGPELKFSGDEVTYTLSDKVTVTKGQGDEAEKIDLSEIAPDSVIRFTTTANDGGDEIIDSIMVMK